MVACQPGIQPPPGGYTEEDVKAIEMLGKLYLNSDIWAFFEWLMEDSTLNELTTRLPDILEGVMQGWGLLNEKGEQRLGVQALKKAFDAIP